MFCTQCGTPLNEGSRFCSACGTAANTAAVQAAPAQPQPVAQPVYAAPQMYSYPVYVMPAPGAAGQPYAAASTTPAAAPAQTAVPAYRQPAPPTPSAPVYRQPAPTQSSQTAPVQTTPAARKPAAEPVPEPSFEDTSKPLSVWQTIVCLLALFCLPVGNIIFACVWGFRLDEHPQRRTLARAALPFIAVGLVVLFVALLLITLNLNTISISFR